jgi:hypothetical protein
MTEAICLQGHMRAHLAILHPLHLYQHLLLHHTSTSGHQLNQCDTHCPAVAPDKRTHLIPHTQAIKYTDHSCMLRLCHCCLQTHRSHAAHHPAAL